VTTFSQGLGCSEFADPDDIARSVDERAAAVALAWK